MIPNDGVMLMSFINMKLRDFYPNLEELCQSLSLDMEDIIIRLGEAGYCYDEDINRFIQL